MCLIIEQIFIIHYAFKFQITPKFEKPMNFMKKIGGGTNIVKMFQNIKKKFKSDLSFNKEDALKMYVKFQ
jgi:hypothetical protein